MNSILKKSLSAIMVFCLMFLCLGLSVRVNAAGTDQTFDMTAASYGNATESVVEWSSDFITMTLEKGSSSTNANNYLGGTNAHTRFYKGQTLSFNVSEGYQINSITITSTSSTYAGNFVSGSWTNASATNNGSVVTVTPADKSLDVTVEIGTATRATSIVVNYEAKSSDPNVTISSNVNYDMVGNSNIQFNSKLENFAEAYPSIWSSSDETVATIDENGKVTALKMGKTEISATANGVKSNVVTINVYPENSEVITVAKALEICELTGENNAPYQYSIFGKVTNIDGDNTYIADDTEEIIVYRLSGVEVGDVVKITGTLVNYQGETKEFTYGATVVKHFNVEFNSDGGTEVSTLENIADGSKISAPDEPTKENYTFIGWFNGEKEWDFAADTVTDNLTLVAKWGLSSLDTIFSAVHNYNSYMCVAYKYSSEDGVISDQLTLASTGVSGNSYTDWSGKSILSSAVYAGQSAGGNSSIQLRSKNSNSGVITTVSGGYAKKVTVEWNAGTGEGKILKVYGSNNPYTSPTELYNNSTYGTEIGEIVCGTSTELVISEDYKYIGLRSKDGAIYLNSISIDWETTIYSNDEFRIKMGIDKGLSTVAEQVDGAKYGIEVSTDSKTQKYYSTDELYKVEEGAEGKEYVIINLGAFLQNHSRISEEFTVKAFIEYDGVTYYSEQSKTYSIKTLVEKYLELGYSEVETLKTTLENLGYTFE